MLPKSPPVTPWIQSHTLDLIPLSGILSKSPPIHPCISRTFVLLIGLYTVTNFRWGTPMTGSTFSPLAANPAPSPETGLISIRFKHSIFECWMPRHLARSVQSCILPSIRSMPTSKYASICSLDANYSFLFVSRIFFTQKYLTLNPLLEPHLTLTGEKWVKLEPLVPPPESSAPTPLCSLLPITWYLIAWLPDCQMDD